MKNTVDGWRYYNHAAIPSTPPHVEVNMKPINDGSIWDVKGALLARWTTDWDCKEETNWYYIIKDSPFNLEDFSAKRRKNLRQALKKCVVTKIDPEKHIKQLYEVYEAAFSKYIAADNKVSYEQFVERCREDKENRVEYWGGFAADSNRLIGYMTVQCHAEYAETCVAKYHPSYLNYRVSDAIHCVVLDYYLNNMKKKYISSGSRNINHITNAQDYKIENFNFRKAYCKLNIIYKPLVRCVVNILYPFRRMLERLDSVRIVHSIIAILKMEEIIRE